MLFTYRDLLEALENMTEEQLDQQVQTLPVCPDKDKAIPLEPVVSFNTIRFFLDDQKTRSSVDNKHYDGDFVLLTDGNMYKEDGTIGFDLITGERLGKGE